MGAKQQPSARQRQLGRAQWVALMASAVFAAVVVTRPSSQPPSGWQRLGDAGASQEGGGWQTLSREEAAARAAAKAAETTEQLLSVLQGRPACVAAATTSPVLVHGWVRKAGALPMSLLDGPKTKERHQAYYRWRDLGDASTQTKEVLVDGKPERVGVPPPLFPYCRVLVNHQYRTLYLKAPKTGSTSLLTLLGTCTGDKSVDKPTCFEPLQPTLSRQAYEQMFADYFVWTVVRNPWARAVSSYRMLSRYIRSECEGLVGGWDSVCRDINRLPLIHDRNPGCTISKVQGEGFAMHHLIPQAPCLVTGSGQWATDYVVRTERLQEDMREVLNQMNARRQEGAEELDVEGTLSQLTNVNKVNVACEGLPADLAAAAAASSTSRRQLLARPSRPAHIEAPERYCSEAQYYTGQHSHCFDAIRTYYSQDMRLFGLDACEAEPAAAAWA